jgi:cytochrome P450
MPHAIIEDEWYDGMLIPDGATLLLPLQILNSIGRDDPSIYDPDTFLQHTRLAPEYARSKDYEKRDHYGYGAGRRICTGIHLAERTQWRIVASVSWAFELRTEDSLDINAYDEGFLQHPKSFHVRFVPRSERHVAVLRHDFAQVANSLEKWCDWACSFAE